MTRGGALGARLKLQSYPGERARLLGRLVVTDSANFVSVDSLDLDGSTAPDCAPGTCTILPSPTVNGDYVSFRDVDVTNQNTAICFNLGSSKYGRAKGPAITDSRIHHCGRLPRTNHDHGIYVSAADGARISGNMIYRNADRGIQQYPESQGTLITDNIIDANGEGLNFSGDSATASSRNVVRHNVISNSRARWNVEANWPGPIGTGNDLSQNCVWATNPRSYYNSKGGVQSPKGFVAAGNVIGNPSFVDQGNGWYGPSASSECARVWLGSIDD